MVQAICSANGCSAQLIAKGLCKAHYARARRNGTLEYVKEPFSRSRDTDTSKECTSCCVVKPRELFYKAKRNKDGLRGTCAECDRLSNRARYTSDPGPALARQRELGKTNAFKERRAAYHQKYYSANFQKYAEAVAVRRALLKAAVVDEGITVNQLRARHGDTCVFCGRTMEFGLGGSVDKGLRASIEHMTPLVRGGAYSWENVRLSCLADNLSKNRKTAAEYLEYRELLGRSSERS